MTAGGRSEAGGGGGEACVSAVSAGSNLRGAEKSSREPGKMNL